MPGARPSGFVFTKDGPLRLYSTQELLEMPPPEWLVDGIIPEGGMIGVYGAPGVKKTFVALDLALCVATGTPWHGHEVQKGLVLYISAEGGTGIGKRVFAWLLKHNIDSKEVDIAWLTESIPVNIDSEQMAILVNRLVDELQRTPVLIVVDTLARCFDGNENEQEDMGRFVAGVDYLRHELRTAVMIIHHTNLSGLRERGNTAFRGATDTMVMVETDGTAVTLTCTKQRDAEDFEPMNLELEPVDGTESAVIVTANGISHREEMVTKVVDALIAIQPAKWDDWMAELVARDIPKNEFFKCRKALTTLGAKKDKQGRWSVQTVGPSQ